MLFLNIVESLFLGPIKFVLELVFQIFYITSRSTLLSTFSLAFAFSMLILPFLKTLHNFNLAVQEKHLEQNEQIANDKQNKQKLKNKLFHLIPFTPLITLVFNCLFFGAACLTLSNLGAFKNFSFGFLSNFGEPDQLIRFKGFSINVLPIVATLINIASIILYTHKFPIKQKIQYFLAPMLFAVPLYLAPSGFALFWTLLNGFLLVETLSFKFKITKKYFRIAYAAISVVCLILSIFYVSFLPCGLLLLLPIIIYLFEIKIFSKIKFINNFINKLQEKFANKTPAKPSGKQFLINTILLTIFIGILIPSTYIAASPQEYIYLNLFFNPLNYILVSFCYAISFFMLYMHWFYWMAGSKGKLIIEKLLFIFSIIIVVDYLFFGLNLGIISSSLKYENGLVFSAVELVVNIIVVIAIYLFFTFAYKKIKSFITLVLSLVIVMFTCMSTINIVNSATSINDYKKSEVYNPNMSFALSTTGHNVIVIMLDRGLGQFLPFIFKEKPELAQKFDGFTHYINTISFGHRTNTAAPAMLGGYEYTPVELNKRDTLSLKDKNNEANLVLPRLFSDNGYNVSVADPVYTNYQWISDLSVFDPYEKIHAFHTIGKFMDNKQTEYIYEQNMNNFFRFSLMKTMPLVLQNVLYNSGNYNNTEGVDAELKYSTQTTDGQSKASGLCIDFMSNYLTLTNMKNMTSVTSDSTNTFLFFRNDITHEPMILDSSEGYVPKYNIDNTEFDKNNTDRWTVDGMTLHITGGLSMGHYHSNMAALIQLGNWLDHLRETGTYDNSRIIITADHGQDLNAFDELSLPENNSVEWCAPLLLVKNFNETGFKTSDVFMTNADVPTLATQNLGFEAKNPFSGKLLSMDEKFAHPQYIINSHIWDVSKNNGNTYLPSTWLSFDSTVPNCNIYDLSKWSLLNEEVVLKNHSFS